MPLCLLLLAVVLSGVSCDKHGEKKPELVDWKQNNFWIRTSRNSPDFLNTVNINTDTRQITRRRKPSGHESRRKQQNPAIIENNIRTSVRPLKQEKNALQTNVDKEAFGASRNLRKNIRSGKKFKGFGYSGINSRPILVAESSQVSGTIKNITDAPIIKKPNLPVLKENLKEKSFPHNNFLKYRLTGFPKAITRTTKTSRESEDETSKNDTGENTSKANEESTTENDANNKPMNEVVEIITNSGKLTSAAKNFRHDSFLKHIFKGFTKTTLKTTTVSTEFETKDFLNRTTGLKASSRPTSIIEKLHRKSEDETLKNNFVTKKSKGAEESTNRNVSYGNANDQDEATYSEKLVGPGKSFQNNFLKHRLTGLSKRPIITTTASTTYETRNMLRRTTTLTASSRPTKTIKKLHGESEEESLKTDLG